MHLKVSFLIVMLSSLILGWSFSGVAEELVTTAAYKVVLLDVENMT